MEYLNLSDVHSGWQIMSDLNGSYDFMWQKQGKAVVLKDRAYTVWKKSLMSWAPGETQWTKVADLKSVRRNDFDMGIVTNGVDCVYMVSGTSLSYDMWYRFIGFVEKYNVTNNMVTTMKGSPLITNNTYTYGRAIGSDICEYWNGYIYATFISYGSGMLYKYRDLRFHIYNVHTETWSVSYTGLDLQFPFLGGNAAIVASQTSVLITNTP